MKVIVGNPWDIAGEIEKSHVTIDRVIPLGCGIDPVIRGEERLRCSVIIITK